MSEYDEQCALFEFARWAGSRVPELDMLLAIPNGEHRNKVTAARLKRAGVKAGVPDALLPVPRKGKHGVWIELKFGTNRCSAFQHRWLSDLRAQGYACVVAYDWQEAATFLLDYLGHDPADFGLAAVRAAGVGAE